MRAFILEGLERLREIAKALSNKETQTAWQRTKLHRSNGLLFDSSADWFTREDLVRRVQQQSDFQNQALEQRLRAAEAGVDKTALQVEEIVRAAGLDTSEMGRVMTSLNQMLTAKDDALTNVKFLVVKLKKTFNDALETYSAKFMELGIPEDEVMSMGFVSETLPDGSTNAPAGLLARA